MNSSSFDAPCLCKFKIEESRASFPGPSQTLCEEYSTHNGYPLLQEAASIEAALEQGKRQESILSETIAGLQSVIGSLVAERTRVQREIGRYRWILRPVQRVPPELLGRIFSLTVDSTIHEDPFQTPSSLHPSGMPWVLSQVCQSWRKISLANTSLWNPLSLGSNPKNADQRFLQAQLYRLKLQLHRSWDYPLDVVVTPRNLNKLLRLLLYQYSLRWRTLHIELDNRDAPAISVIRQRLPLLESLYVRCTRYPLNELDCFRFAPRLRTLVLSGEVRQSDWRVLLRLPDRQIHHFCYEQSNDDGVMLCQLILEHQGQGENLKSCRFSFGSEAIASFLATQAFGSEISVVFPHLTRLELYHSEMKPGIHAILSWITISSPLKILAISSTGPDRTPFVNFFTRSSPDGRTTPSPSSLTSLTIHRVEMPASEFAAVLRLLTGLENLKFGVQNGITDDYLELLYAPGPSVSSFSIVPKLKTLSLLPTVDDQSRYDEDKLANLLERRWRGLAGMPGSVDDNRLLFVELDRAVLNESVRRRLEELRSEGMCIEEI